MESNKYKAEIELELARLQAQLRAAMWTGFGISLALVVLIGYILTRIN